MQQTTRSLLVLCFTACTWLVPAQAQTTIELQMVELFPGGVTISATGQLTADQQTGLVTGGFQQDAPFPAGFAADELQPVIKWWTGLHTDLAPESPLGQANGLVSASVVIDLGDAGTALAMALATQVAPDRVLVQGVIDFRQVDGQQLPPLQSFNVTGVELVEATGPGTARAVGRDIVDGTRLSSYVVDYQLLGNPTHVLQGPLLTRTSFDAQWVSQTDVVVAGDKSLTTIPDALDASVSQISAILDSQPQLRGQRALERLLAAAQRLITAAASGLAAGDLAPRQVGIRLFWARAALRLVKRSVRRKARGRNPQLAPTAAAAILAEVGAIDGLTLDLLDLAFPR